MRRRHLRDFDDFDRAAAEVIRHCAPTPFKALMRQVGGWAPPDSLTAVSPALLYNIAIGIGRNKWCLRLEKREREQRGAARSSSTCRKDDGSALGAWRTFERISRRSSGCLGCRQPSTMSTAATARGVATNPRSPNSAPASSA